ncbi:MAG: hypothetical protein RhofKO_01170 [Rhodothermales bacterium]
MSGLMEYMVCLSVYETCRMEYMTGQWVDMRRLLVSTTGRRVDMSRRMDARAGLFDETLRLLDDTEQLYAYAWGAHRRAPLRRGG